ncbi:DNA excision repair protein ERCC-6 [Amphibalanus amphitrite]|uniref:DNA repair and recombination protein RAD54-like n=1 Tax=Amphibalanus amphitrite TaxID=1232801 RepID=A0A6A4WE65_AMPAM|nr:DNA excision repair protein ERCC-6 [Amphibalanus amphitrite]
MRPCLRLQVRTPHRVILSGSPLQNNLRELWSLFDFVFPGKLGTLPVFHVTVVTAYRCAKVLRDTIAPYLLRRMKADVQQTLQLPTKNEQARIVLSSDYRPYHISQVLFCRLTDVQRQLYQDYLNSDGLRRIMQGNMKVFVGLTALRKLCNHPDLLTGGGERPGETADEPAPFGHWRLAGKMVVLSTLLAMWRRQEHKVLLFTQSRQMLSIVEAFVAERGYSYLRMDGSTSVGSRQSLIGRFNAEPDIFCFLLTTRVGGLGVNLTGANRIVIYDPDWNPSTDQQARERAWRIGQGRHVTIYRLLTAGTIEEKIYHRQIFKQFLTNRVLKDPKQQRFFKTNDLHDLFTLTEDAPEDDGGSAAGSGGGRQRPVVSQTTETAEMFSGSQDDYVLTKLFKKSGVHSAVRHDVIESHGTHDGAVLEAEAAKVAKEAVAALRASRREVRAAGIGTPTWTGQSGRAGIPTKPRFGQKKNPLLAAKPAPPPPPPPVKKPAAPSLPALFAPDTARRPARPAAVPTAAPTSAPNLFGGSAALGLGALGNSASADNAPLSSAQLLARIRRRADGEDGAEAVEVAQEHADLLADIRNFVAFQTNTNGRASTSELLGEFKARLPPEQSALFKALLTGICEFERGADKVGWWVLREELR